MRYFIIFLLALSALTTHAQCNQFPTLNLGPDITLCPGQQVTLNLPNGYDYHNWNIGGNVTSVTVSSTQQVILQVQNVSTNIIVNGDFENGNTGFTSDYIVGTGGAFGQLSNPGTYAVNTSPSNVHNNFSVCGDHTSGVGNMLIANGSSTPNSNVWCQTVTVTPNTNYNFSAWIGNALNDPNISNLQFSINGVQLGPIFSTTPTACNWQEFNQVWNSMAVTSAQLCILNQNTAGGGNDFVIDDITFTPSCVQVDTVQVTIDPSSIDAGNPITFCENDPQSVTATTNFANPSFLWETGSTNASIVPTTSGYYTVATTTPNNCVISDSVQVTIIPMPWNIDETGSQATGCGVNSGVVFVTTTGSFNQPPSYTWTGPGQNSGNSIDASVWQNLSPGWYYLTITSQGCTRTDSAFVDILNPPVAVLNANPTTGTNPLTVNFTNSSQNADTYFWDLGNGVTANATDLSGQSTTYTADGIYSAMLVAYQGNCSDTAYVTILVTPPPIPPVPPVIVPVDISFPNIITPNGDLVNDRFEPTLLNIKSLSLTITNRWGQIVYDSSDINQTWDGKTNGLILSDGVYFYTYTAIGAQNEELSGQGYVHVNR